VEWIDAPLIAAEVPMLEGWLDFQRASLALTCEGLSPEQPADRSAHPRRCRSSASWAMWRR
jgi:hypothetical protein